jgi:hypothetical protein
MLIDKSKGGMWKSGSEDELKRQLRENGLDMPGFEYEDEEEESIEDTGETLVVLGRDNWIVNKRISGFFLDLNLIRIIGPNEAIGAEVYHAATARAYQEVGNRGADIGSVTITFALADSAAELAEWLLEFGDSVSLEEEGRYVIAGQVFPLQVVVN